MESIIVSTAILHPLQMGAEELPHDPERDPQILQITNSLCQQLDITNYHPTFVSWQVYAYKNRRNPTNRREFPSDECLLEKYSITLSGSMRGKLEPDEWKPIIASALIFSKKMRRRTFYGFLFPGILFVALAFLIFVEFPILFPQPYSSTDRGTPFTVPIGSVFGNIIALILGGPGTVVVGTILARKTRLLADKRAAGIVGNEVFLSSLRKIAGLSSPQQWKKRGGSFAGPVPLLPRLDSRITYLETSTNSG